MLRKYLLCFVLLLVSSSVLAQGCRHSHPIEKEKSYIKETTDSHLYKAIWNLLIINAKKDIQLINDTTFVSEKSAVVVVKEGESDCKIRDLDYLKSNAFPKGRIKKMILKNEEKDLLLFGSHTFCVVYILINANE